MTEQQLRRAKQSVVQDTFSMRSLAHCKQTYSLLLKYPGKIGNTYPNERGRVECYERVVFFYNVVVSLTYIDTL